MRRLLAMAGLLEGGASTSELPTSQWHHPGEKEQLDHSSFAAYLQSERNLIEKTFESYRSEEKFHRYYYRDETDFKWKIDGNVSKVLMPEGSPQGAVLLIHGLTDSPYFLASIGKVFQGLGFVTILMRLPGHGTHPGALRDHGLKDWYACVKRFYTWMQSMVPDGKLIVGGFSTGGSLAVKLTLDRQIKRKPDHAVLFAPAFGIDRWAKLTSFVSKVRPWANINLEYDPFKYLSFPTRSAYEVYRLIRDNRSVIHRLRNVSTKFTVFQSAVDSTVHTTELLEYFGHLKSPDTQINLFDLNHEYAGYILGQHLNWIENNQMTINQVLGDIMLYSNGSVSKKGQFSPHLIRHLFDHDIKRFQPNGDLNYRWPHGIFALSHISLTIPKDDQLYGTEGLIGKLHVKGETNTALPFTDSLRLRYNPFFDLFSDILSSRVTDK